MGLRLTNRKVLARNPVVGRAAAIPGHPPASGSAFLSKGDGDNLEVRAPDLQGGNLQEILSIFGTEHLNLNTYYARPMADLFDTHSDGKWDFKAVASTLLKLTTLFGPNTNINYTAGPNLKPTHDVHYWTAKTRNYDFSGERPRASRALQQDPLGRPEGHARSRYQNPLLESRSRQRHKREIGHIESQIARTIASRDSIRLNREWDTR
jgi:hypothetical protein